MKESELKRVAIVTLALAYVFSGCSSASTMPPALSQAVVIEQEGMPALREELTATASAAPQKVAKQAGLMAAWGGTHIKLLKAGRQEVLLPLPQLVARQVPVCFYISSTPSDAVRDYRLGKRNDANVVVSVRLSGKRDQEVHVEWSSVVLVATEVDAPAEVAAERFLPATACVQSDAEAIAKLAEELWPASGVVADYAVNVQGFVRDMKRQKQPRSLDALGILDSGANGICMANANLALALLRAKGIAARSTAVIPPISRRLEMHRIVHYVADDKWHAFDPSLLHADIPMKSWQSVIMAQTSIADENIAMKPRMGTMLGCPYGQELEIASSGVTLWGQDFFWTMAKTVAEFEPPDDAVAMATTVWNEYLKTGKLSSRQIKAATAQTAAEFSEWIGSP
jgi:hypothetical protein